MCVGCTQSYVVKACTYVVIPKRRTQTTKRWHKLYAKCVVYAKCQIFTFARISNQMCLVFHPVDTTPSIKHRTFKCIGCFATDSPSHCCKHICRFYVRFLPYVQQQKTACAISVFNVAFVKTSLPHKAGLLVAQNTTNWYGFAINVSIANVRITIHNLGQNVFWHTKQSKQFVIPLAFVDIKKHCSARVGWLGDKMFAVG